MKINKSEFIGSCLIFSYIILLIFTKLLSNISQYNAIVYAVFCMLFFLLIRYNLFLKSFFTIISLIIAIFSYTNNSHILYICIDIAIVYFILSIFPLYDSIKFSRKHIKLLNYLSLSILLLSLLASFNPSNYTNLGGDVRFLGFFKYGNLSASIVAILCIVYWESFKILYNRKRKTILVLTLSFFLIYIFLCKTRSLLFFAPYYIYQFYSVFGKKVFYSFSIIIVFIVSFSIYEELKALLRIEEDASFSTREGLYILLIEGIKENYVVFPHGSRSSTDLVESYFNDSSLTPHNDFLRYLYDWGVALIILLYIIINEFKRRHCFNFNNILITLGYSSFALHNMLFLPYVFLPYLFILILLRYKI